MSTTRRSVLAGTIGAAALGLTGCGLGGSTQDAGSASPVEGEVKGEISFQTWSLKNDTFTSYFEDLVKDFEKKNPGTKVSWADQPGDGYQEKVLSQANSGSLPDVVNLPPDMSYPLAQGGFLLDLASADKDLDSVYVDGGVKAYQFDDVKGSYGYPWYLGTDLNWWNLAELSENGIDESSLPTSYDELFEAARTLKKAGSRTPLISNMPEIVITSDDSGFTFDTSENVSIVQQYADLYSEGAIPPEVLNDDYAGNTTLFKQGKVAWTTGTSSLARELGTEAPTVKKNTAVTTRFGTPPLFVQGVCVAGKSKNLPTALAFAKFLTDDANQIAFAKLAQGFLPGTKKASADPSAFADTGSDALMKKAVDLAATAMKTAVSRTNVLWTDDMKTNLAQQLGKALKGQISAEAALKNAVEYGNKNLS